MAFGTFATSIGGVEGASAGLGATNDSFQNEPEVGDEPGDEYEPGDKDPKQREGEQEEDVESGPPKKKKKRGTGNSTAKSRIEQGYAERASKKKPLREGLGF